MSPFRDPQKSISGLDSIGEPAKLTDHYQFVPEMIWPKRDKEKERFYLLAGMGGRSLRRKRRIFLAWSIAAGIIVSAIMAIILYFVNAQNH